MKENLIQQIATAPNNSGIYQFFDKNRKALYVGKAKNLKKRLTSYTKGQNLNIRIRKMVSLAHEIEIVQTLSETEALLLECNLIKKLMPRYNILLRDGKTFAYIEISKENFGKINKFRGKKDPKNYYFGPFASGYAIDKTIDVLKKSFLLRSCSDSFFKNRKEPCLEYQIKRCSAPCVNFISQENYQELINEALDFLAGKSRKVEKELTKKMNQSSANLDYENAAKTRDRIKAICEIQKKQNINIMGLKNSDIIVLAREKTLAVVYISFYRSGHNYGSKPYFISVNDDDCEQEIMTNFISQFYLDETSPSNIVIDREIEDIKIMQEFLSNQAQYKVMISNPQKGLKYQLIKDQTTLANQELQQKLAKIE